MPTLHQIISARGAVEKSVACFMHLAYYNANNWFSSCEKVFKIMELEDEPLVEDHGGICVMYSQGYTAPLFVQCGAGFISPFWS